MNWEASFFLWLTKFVLKICWNEARKINQTQSTDISKVPSRKTKKIEHFYARNKRLKCSMKMPLRNRIKVIKAASTLWAAQRKQHKSNWWLRRDAAFGYSPARWKYCYFVPFNKTATKEKKKSFCTWRWSLNSQLVAIRSYKTIIFFSSKVVRVLRSHRKKGKSKLNVKSRSLTCRNGFLIIEERKIVFLQTVM